MSNSNASAPGAPSLSPPRVDARVLLASHREIILVFKDTEYRLRLTSNDKLILTK